MALLVGIEWVNDDTGVSTLITLTFTLATFVLHVTGSHQRATSYVKHLLYGIIVGLVIREVPLLFLGCVASIAGLYGICRFARFYGKELFPENTNTRFDQFQRLETELRRFVDTSTTQRELDRARVMTEDLLLRLEERRARIPVALHPEEDWVELQFRELEERVRERESEGPS